MRIRQSRLNSECDFSIDVYVCFIITQQLWQQWQISKLHEGRSLWEELARLSIDRRLPQLQRQSRGNNYVWIRRTIFLINSLGFCLSKLCLHISCVYMYLWKVGLRLWLPKAKGQKKYCTFLFVEKYNISFCCWDKKFSNSDINIQKLKK